ncbi:MAG: DUF445 family protein [Anaeromicrobium sp.]|uniref:DUF445 domain-containing protein n=1 Tax=Anaeromicrobium sp. TaxID=1929132 RepID=UPI0025E1DE6A|nr:DUF445 family protein [Anaeromicrobium sp.]MCT4594108.1 DUF445 family protein [Anaeromicrobium sp.]
MFWIKLLILTTIGAMIGWITNILAIKLIFRPLEPVKIPLTNSYFQGLIPKRQSEIAKSVGEMIEKELLSMEELIDRILSQANKEEIINIIKVKINGIIEEKMPPFIPTPFKGMIQEYIEDVIEKEGNGALEDIMDELVDKAIDSVKINEIVEEKINDFPLPKLEEIVMTIAKKELKHIEILGGILGGMIGIIQGLIILAF